MSTQLRCAAFIVLTILLQTLSVAPRLSAQSNSSETSSGHVAKRDSSAVLKMEAARAALGGNTIETIGSAWARGTYTASDGATSTFVWKNAGRKFRYQQGGSVVVHNGRTVKKTVDGKTASLSPDLALAHVPLYLSAVVLKDRIESKQFSFLAFPAATLNGKNFVRIQTKLEGDEINEKLTRQIWWIDPDRNLPVRVEYWLPDLHNSAVVMAFTTDLSDFRSVGGILIPYHLETYFNGQHLNSVQIDEVGFNQNVSSEDFDDGDSQ
jgi:hypothetical protein